MKKYITLLFFAVCGLFYGQVDISSEEVNGEGLGGSRRVTIVPPDNYDRSYSYPMILVLDANNLLEPTASNVRYMMKTGEIPPSIVVGIYTKTKDLAVNEEDGMPTGDSAAFYEYVGIDVLPYLNKKYSLNEFKCIIGSDDGANFLNYYLLKEKSLFNAYVCLNPTLNKVILESLPKQAGELKTPIFYYLATTNNDDNVKVKNTTKFSKELKGISNDNFIYYSGDFPQITPRALPLGGIPESLNLFFEDFRPISMKEYAEKIMKIESNVVEYLQKKYERIEKRYLIKKQASLNDIAAIYSAAEKKMDWQSLPILVDFIKKDYKKTALPDYIEGEYYYRVENYKKSLKAFQNAYIKEPIDFVTKDLLVEKMDELKKLSNSSGKKRGKNKGDEPVIDDSTAPTPETGEAPQGGETPATDTSATETPTTPTTPTQPAN